MYLVYKTLTNQWKDNATTPKVKDKWANASTSSSWIKKCQCPKSHKDTQMTSDHRKANLNMR